MTDSTPHDGFTSTDAARAADTETSASDAHRSRAYDSDAHDSDAHASYDAPRRASGSASDAETTASSVPAAAHANAVSRPHDRNDVGDGPQYGVGPFSLREVVLLGIWVVAFFVSFFRTNILDAPSGVLVGGANVWLSGLWWIPAVALPTVAVGLLALRRLSPQGIRRVGSLGIDQFASVAFTVSALVWVSWVWDTVAVFTSTGVWTRSWVMWVEAVVLLAGVVLTVFAPLIPPFSADFRGRDDVPAHRNARPIRPVVSRPRAPRTPRPVAAASTGVEADAEAPTPGSYTGSTDLAHEPAPATSVLPAHTDDHETDVFAPLRADFDDARHDEAHDERSPHENADDVRDRADAEARGDHARWAASSRREGNAEEHADDHPHAQAFWALAPEEREIVDDYGTPIFHIGPTAWALVIEDRGETFVVRHDDGRIGYLHDVSGVTRG